MAENYDFEATGGADPGGKQPLSGVKTFLERQCRNPRTIFPVTMKKKA